MSREKIFVDTNIFLRYLTNDDAKSADRIEKVFQKARDGKISLMTSSLVIAEIIWVLESYYGRSKDEIDTMITGILNTRGLEIEDSSIIYSALDTYVSKNIDYADAFNAQYMMKKGLSRILTLDRKHFARIEGIIVEDLRSS